MNTQKLNPEELKGLLPEALVKMLLDQETVIELLQKDAEAKDSECEDHLKTIEEQAGKIEQLNTVIGTANTKTVIEIEKKKVEAPVIPAEPFEYKGKSYKWLRAAFRLPGDIKKYSCQDAAGNENVMDKLLAIEGQGILKELE